jgi:hypothetical protein
MRDAEDSEDDMGHEPVAHPALMEEAKREREVADSPEAEDLQDAIFKAVLAYSTFLERNGLIWEFGLLPEEPEWPRRKAQALVVTHDYDSYTVQIDLMDGALDRVYGNGVNPDPYGLGPPDIPHKRAH